MGDRSEEHTSELQSRQYLVCRLLLEKKNDTRCGQLGAFGGGLCARRVERGGGGDEMWEPVLRDRSGRGRLGRDGQLDVFFFLWRRPQRLSPPSPPGPPVE